jgi:hypothetical protein
MRNTIFVFLALASMLLVFGCIGAGAQQPVNNNPPSSGPAGGTINNTENTTNPLPPAQTCEQYCQAQPHAQCAGKWNITGAYPACTCGYVCDAIAPENGTNASTAPLLPTPKPINASVSEMLDSTMKKAVDDFYRENSGSFTEKSYTWARVSMDTDLKDITFDAAPAGDVTFDSKPDKGILTSGFTVFQNNDDETRQAYGVAIFKGMTSVLDAYPAADLFAVDYFPPVIDKKLRECSVYSKDYYSTTQGDWFVAYSFVCWKVYDK